MSEDNDCGSRWLLNLIDQRPEEGNATLEAFENVAFVLYCGMTVESFDHDSFLQTRLPNDRQYINR